jgi:HPt (histidine-containing phosphotransfer) domain-containing protein
MPSVPPPTEALAELAAVLGEDNVRTLVRTFLRDFPASLRDLGGGQRKDRHRIAHSMKSNSRLMGAHDLADRMAALETRLEGAEGADVNEQDLTAIATEYGAIAGPLRAFVGD